jgi:hypothetical protein
MRGTNIKLMGKLTAKPTAKAKSQMRKKFEL